MLYSHFVALCIFSLYFLVILGLFYLILQNLWNHDGKSNFRNNKGKIATFILLTIASLSHTWFYMFKFMAWSFANYEQSLSILSDRPLERLTSWLLNTGLFEQAWAAVCAHPLNWWWSEQLCLFTAGAWTVFLASKGHQHRIRYVWAYMVLGQLVAISAASNLFYLSLVLFPSTPFPGKSGNHPMRAHTILWMNVLASLVTIGLSPFTTERTFLPNLLTMHSLLVVPLLSTSSAGYHPSRWSIKTSTLYFLIFIIAFPLRLRTVLTVLSSLQPGEQSAHGLLSAEWTTLHTHPAQSSIGWDIIWTSISFVVWVFLRPDEPSSQRHSSKIARSLYALLATPFASVGITAPYLLRPLETAATIEVSASTDHTKYE